MKYKISEFCRLLGVSTDTLRYYERCKLLTTDKNPENSYRTFTRQDGLAIWNLHMLRSMDMSCKDIQSLRMQGGYTAQTAYLHQRADELEATIHKLTIKRKRLLQLAQLHGLLDDTHTIRLVPDSQPHWALYVLGDGCDHAAPHHQDTARWMASLPFTYFAVEIALESLLRRKGTLRIRTGLGILEENVHPAGLALGDQAEYTPTGTRVCTVVSTHDVFSMTHQHLALLYDYLAKHQLRVTGPATGRILCSDCDAKQPEYRVALGIPVEYLTTNT